MPNKVYSVPIQAIYHGRWVVEFEGGKVIKMIDDFGNEHSYEEVIRHTVDYPRDYIRNAGWEPISISLSRKALAKNVFCYPDSIDPRFVDVVRGSQVICFTDCDTSAGIGDGDRQRSEMSYYGVNIDGHNVLYYKPSRIPFQEANRALNP